MTTDLIIWIILGVAVVLFFILSNLRIVPQSKAVVMERLGVYSRTWHTGLHIKLPIVERPARKLNPGTGKRAVNYAIDLKENFMDVAAKEVITKDNVRMNIDTIIFYQITDPMRYVYGHAEPENAIKQLAATAIRNLVGEIEFDDTLVSRDHVNTRMRTILDEAADAWGIRVTRVEVQSILPVDESILKAMEKQMTAERERRAVVIEAEGERKAAILKAEGIKQATILKAEGEKQKKILEAEAEREKMICEAEGEAEAILQVQQATAEGIKMVNASEPSKEVLAIKSLEAFEKAADGQATKIIIPSEIQSLAGLAKSASEVFEA